MTKPPLADRYADQLIANQPELYNAIEVHGVRDTATSTDGSTCIEVDNVSPDFFSVYLHAVEGGCVCVGDFSLPRSAREYAETLKTTYSWPVHDYITH